MQLNEEFISNIYDIYGEAGEAWIQDLSSRIKHLSSLWNFHLLHSMPSLTYNYVGLVKINSTGKTAVIKMSPDGANIANEVRWLSCMESVAPKIYESDQGLSAFLMENLKPGSSLKKYLQQDDDDSATKIICQIIRKLQLQQQTDLNFRHLSELSDGFSTLKGHFDLKLLSKAEGLFKDLTSDRSQDVVLHGDLHHDNILLSENGWKVIDPHGYIGDPASEVGSMVRNFFDYLPKNESVSKAVARRLHIMADELPFDPQRIKAWALCMTTLSAAWTHEDHGKVKDIDIEIAVAIDQTRLRI
jgi:streptomycin 6-kinase